MIARLRQRRSFSDPGLERLAELVRAVEPLKPQATCERPGSVRERRETLRERRVRERLDARRRVSPWPRRLAWLLATGGGLAFAATMAGRLIVERRAPIAAPAPSRTPARVAAQPAVAAPIVVPVAPPPPSVNVPSVAVPARVRVTRAPRVEAAAPPRQPPSAPPGKSDGAALLSDALVALRRDHDLARAARRADTYLARHGDGDLVEEALAIAVEAAAARGDVAAAAAYADRYLTLFPDGRFAGWMRRYTPASTGSHAISANTPK
jgi:hypothetical protein